MLNVSYKTLKRFCEENNFVKQSNNDFTDNQLDNHVSQFINDHPNIGSIHTMGYIQGNTNLRPTRQRVRESLARVDPDGLELRRIVCQRRFIRRVYNVEGPHHLWHMDGHHKLIRYGLITHG